MLYIVATPIGNIEDISQRALRILEEVDFVLSEDTRKTGFLLKRLGIQKKLVSFFDKNEAARIPWIIQKNVFIVPPDHINRSGFGVLES